MNAETYATDGPKTGNKQQPPIMDMPNEELGELPDYDDDDPPPPRPDQKEGISYAALLDEMAVSPTEDIGPPPICITIDNGETTAVLGTLGNLSVAIGKAKSRKTFLVGAVVASLLQDSPVINRIKGHAPTDRAVVLYFDTEQGRYHVQRSIKRICALASVTDLPNLRAYGLRSVPTQERRAAIEWAIYNTPGVFFVVIDGIRDLVFDINSPEEATATATRLLRWTDERQIHILTVLHQNKGDQNARGHLGTELVNKAETVLSVTKDPDNKAVSIVAAEQCRDMDFEPFSFSVNSYGLPCFVDEPDNPKPSKRDKKNKSEAISPEEVDTIFSRAFTIDTHLGYGQLRTNVLAGSLFIGKPLSKNDAEMLVSESLASGRLGKEKPEGKGHEKYYLTSNKDCPDKLS
ncbi:AAA family ATPase [Fibrella sp. HMF5335]|uniref:AAA family ATPase n=1 Tax=Fibrella rubiginis TaxID=2817060 RepID=A0A939GJG3_9BACT|nr:AAA family ATPase [Fibrella rubiginis]MBO0937905.1 AAA family ATPase [Fibrella rubiginis]